MSESRKFVIKETLLVLAGVLVCAAAMCGVYALLGRFALRVLWGALVGSILSVGNFFFMAVSATLAADKAEANNVTGGKVMMKSSYFIRMVVLALILFVCAKSELFDLFALVLPLVFVRPVLSLLEFFRKSGESKI